MIVSSGEAVRDRAEVTQGGDGLAATRLMRLFAYVSVVAGVAGVASTIPCPPALRALLLLTLMLTGPGCAVLCWIVVPPPSAWAGVIGLSLAAVVILTTTLVRWDAWQAEMSCALLALGVTVSGLLRLWVLRRCVVAPVEWPRFGLGGSIRYCILLLAVALAMWLVALELPARSDGSDYGLLASVGGAVLIAAMCASVGSFVTALITGHRCIAAVAVLGTVCVGRLTATLITEVPIYAYTYKHIGVVDYLLTQRSLAPYWTDIYVRWPGFFTVMAWFSSNTGLDPVDAAHWFAPVTDVVIAVVVGLIALTVTRNRDAALVAALVAQLVNWVGQDYYSPQALSFILALAVLALLLCSRVCPPAGYLSIPVFTAAVTTHQLTPVWICAVVTALAVFRLARPRWLPIAYLGIWAVYVIPRLDSVMRYGLVNFDPIGNTSGVTFGGRAESAGYRFTVVVDRGLTVSLWLLALCCAVVLWRRKARPGAVVICAFSPMLLIVGQNYGGEAPMRVFLYSLAGCAILVAPFLARGLISPRKALVSRSAVWVLLTAFALAGLQGYYSSWSFSTVTPTQVEQSRALLQENLYRSAMTVWASSAGWPARPSADYVPFALKDSLYDVPLDELRFSVLEDVPDGADMDSLEAGPDSTGDPMYVVLPRQLFAYDEWVGLFKPGVLDAFTRQLQTRPGWTRTIDDADTVVYRYAPEMT